MKTEVNENLCGMMGPEVVKKVYAYMKSTPFSVAPLYRHYLKNGIIQDIRKGATYKDMIRKHGVSRMTVSRIKKRYVKSRM